MILGCHYYQDIINKIIIYINHINREYKRIYIKIRNFAGYSYLGSWCWFSNFFCNYNDWCYCDNKYYPTPLLEFYTSTMNENNQ